MQISGPRPSTVITTTEAGSPTSSGPNTSVPAAESTDASGGPDPKTADELARFSGTTSSRGSSRAPSRGQSALDVRLAGAQALSSLQQLVAALNLPLSVLTPTPATPAPTTTTPAATTTAGLSARLSALEVHITDSQTRVTELNTALQALQGQVSAKRGTVQSLLAEKATLESDIATAQTKINDLVKAAAIASIFVPIPPVGIAAIVTKLNGYTAQKTAVEGLLAHNVAETQAIESAIAQYDATETQLRGVLGGLQGEQKGIQQALSSLRAGGDPARILPVEVAICTSLHDNLMQQLTVLTTLRDNARGFSAGLDGVISHLKARIDTLKIHKAEAEEAVAGALADLVIQMGAVPASVRAGALTIDTKALIINADAALKQAFVDKVDETFAHLPTPLRTQLVGAITSALA